MSMIKPDLFASSAENNSTNCCSVMSTMMMAGGQRATTAADSDSAYLNQLEELDEILDEAEGILDGKHDSVYSIFNGSNNSGSSNNNNGSFQFEPRPIGNDGGFINVIANDNDNGEDNEPLPWDFSNDQASTTDFLKIFSTSPQAQQEQPKSTYWTMGDDKQDIGENSIVTTAVESSSCWDGLVSSMKMTAASAATPRRVSSSSIDNSCIVNSGSPNTNNGNVKVEQWNERFSELQQFKQQFGHCLVPHNWDGNRKLSQWVKRQRYQHRLLQQGRHSTLTNDRILMLEEIGFVWNSHKAGWEEKFQQLTQYHQMYGHCKVPCSWNENPSLGIWVKFQRRQYKLRCMGKSNTLTNDRVQRLCSLGFVFDPCNTMK